MTADSTPPRRGRETRPSAPPDALADAAASTAARTSAGNAASNAAGYAAGGPRRSAPPPNRWIAWPVLALLLATAGWVFWAATQELRADWTSAPAHMMVGRWAEGVSQPASRAQWEAMRTDLLEAAAIQPQDPVLHEALCNLHLVGAQQPWGQGDERMKLLAEAQRHIRTALALRPSDGLLWGLLASTLGRSGNTGADFENAAQKALALGPNEGHVQQLMMLVATEHWDRAPASLQHWAENLYDKGTQAQRDAINRIADIYGLKFESDQPPRQDLRR